jgi:pimeloyl-ACP methyl ester carboxylesterase
VCLPGVGFARGRSTAARGSGWTFEVPLRAGVTSDASWMIEQFDQSAQQEQELREVLFAKGTCPLRLRRFDLFTGDAIDPPAKLGAADQGRTSILRITHPLDVAVPLEPVDRVAHRQFVRAIGGAEYRPLIEQTLGVRAFEQLQANADTFFQIEGPSVNAWQFGAAEAARLQQPVLLLGGVESRPVYHEGRAWLLERLPRAEGQVVHGANHLLPLQQPRRLAQTLANFFAMHPIADSR